MAKLILYAIGAKSCVGYEIHWLVSGKNSRRFTVRRVATTPCGSSAEVMVIANGIASTVNVPLNKPIRISITELLNRSKKSKQSLKR